MVGLSTDGGLFTILTSIPFEFFSNPNFFIIHFVQKYPQLKFLLTTPRLILPECWLKDATFGCHPSLMFSKGKWNWSSLAHCFSSDRIRPVTIHQEVFLSPTYDVRISLPFAKASPLWIITTVRSDDCPVEAKALKIFLPVSAPPMQTFTQVNMSTLTHQLPGNTKKVAEANKGDTKLFLLCSCGTIDENFTTVGDIDLVKPSKGMDIILSTAHAAWPVAFFDLVRETCTTAKEYDCLNLRSKLVLIAYTPKLFASHILAKNLSVKAAVSLNNEANSINPFLIPSTEELMRDWEKVLERFDCENQNSSMDVADCYKSRSNISTTRIGTMLNMTDFTSLCINYNHDHCFVNNDAPQSLYRKFHLKFIKLLNNPGFDELYCYCINKGRILFLPLAHIHIPSLKWNLTLFPEFATNLETWRW